MTLVRPPWCRAAPEGHIHRVLMAEDDGALRDLLTDVVHGEGYSVAARADGAEALEEARFWWPCLAVVDLMMPGMDGPSFIAACRADADLRELPIVVLTASLREPAVDRLPVQGFVPKPFDLHHLLATIVAMIGSARDDSQTLAKRVTF